MKFLLSSLIGGLSATIIYTCPTPGIVSGLSQVAYQLAGKDGFYVYAKYSGSLGANDADCQMIKFEDSFRHGGATFTKSEVIDKSGKRKKVVEQGAIRNMRDGRIPEVVYAERNLLQNYDLNFFNVIQLTDVDNVLTVLLYKCEETYRGIKEDVIILSSSNGFGGVLDEAFEGIVDEFDLNHHNFYFPMNSQRHCNFDEEDDTCDPCQGREACTTLIDCNELTPPASGLELLDTIETFNDEFLFQFDIVLDSDTTKTTDFAFIKIGENIDANNNFGETFLSFSRKVIRPEGGTPYTIMEATLSYASTSFEIPNTNTMRISFGLAHVTSSLKTTLVTVCYKNMAIEEIKHHFEMPRFFLEDVKVYLSQDVDRTVVLKNFFYQDISKIENFDFVIQETQISSLKHFV